MGNKQDKITGKGGISATVIADSISPTGVRLTTLEIEVHRMVWSEFMTHRMLSRNAASTRAVPVAKVIEMVKQHPAMPTHWGANNPGMKSNAELDPMRQQAAEAVWLAMRDEVVRYTSVLSNKEGINGHKQWTGRVLEPFTMIKAVVSATELNNFFHLRDHPDAQPEIRQLAIVMKEALDKSTPTCLSPGQWHLPYVMYNQLTNSYWADENTEVDLETAKKISASCCAQVSYRNLDTSVEKALAIFDMLNLNNNSGQPAHASPIEHQATPMSTLNRTSPGAEWEPGITHIDRAGTYWSGNFRGWIQNRQLYANESVKG
jgi:hypothetical protein